MPASVHTLRMSAPVLFGHNLACPHHQRSPERSGHGFGAKEVALAERLRHGPNLKVGPIKVIVSQ